jgi:hypothetical protein
MTSLTDARDSHRRRLSHDEGPRQRINGEGITHAVERIIGRGESGGKVLLDPQEERDHLPVTDQNERLAKDHPGLVTHRIYAKSGHNIFASRPDWFVRDAVELLEQVRRRR